MKRFVPFLIIFFISTGFTVRADAIEVTAQADKLRLSSQEALTLTITVTDAEGSVDTSSIEDFKVLGQGTSTSVQIINGQVSRKSTHRYTLLPLKKGTLHIPPLQVEVDGKNYMTNDIQVTVSDTPDETSGKSDHATSPELYLEAEISDASPFVGQQIVYTFRLLTAVNIANPSFQPPAFEGFSSREIEPHKTYKKVVGQKTYHVEEVNYVLIPVKTGPLVIQPALLNCRLFTKRDQDPFSFGSAFDNPFFRSRTTQKFLRTKSLPVEVKPLPPFKGQGKFSGLVGQFSITSTVEKDVFHVGDSTTLNIIIKGTGNIMDAKTPDIDLPDAFKVYEDKPEEKIKIDHQGYSGSKTFRLALVGVTAGDFNIEPVRLTYFNTDKKQYKTGESSPIHLSIRPSLQKDTLEVVSADKMENTKVLKKKVIFTGRDILPLKEKMDALENQETISFGWFFVLLLSPALLYGILWTSVRITRKKDDPAIIMAERAETALKAARKSTNDPDKLLSYLYRALISAVLAKGGMKGESLTYSETETILQQNGISSQTAKEVTMLLMRIDSIRYGGEEKNPEFLKDLLQKIQKMIERLR
jgi:hypothetical protein